MVTQAMPIITGAEVASRILVDSVKALYGIAKGVDEFLNEHIAQMKGSENPTVSRTGRVLEMAKYGFGVGYITPVIVIATGQLILGNSLAAISTVATAATLSNPVAMTCAAVGAIYYGWAALTDQEREEMLEKLSQGLDIGVEFIKSVIHFVTDKIKEFLNSDNLNDIKSYISNAAHMFGKTLGDVTKNMSDKIVDGWDTVRDKTSDVVEKTGEILANACDVVKEQGGKALDRLKTKKGKPSADNEGDPSF